VCEREREDVYGIKGGKKGVKVKKIYIYIYIYIYSKCHFDIGFHTEILKQCQNSQK
jgi:hypothetical protein